MRIGIEAQRLFRPHKHGMDRVALELIKNLQLLDTKNEYFIFTKPDEDRAVVSDTSNFNIVEIPGGPYPVWEQIKLPKFAKKYKCDILHCTSNTAPLFASMPLITTLHDIIFKETSIHKQLLSGASWYQKLGNLYRRLIVAQVIKKSRQLITVSNFEKQNIKNWFNINDENLKAVYNGVSKKFTTNISEQNKVDISKKYELPSRFLLHIGNSDPRKNTKGVLKAFYRYTTANPGTHKLVLIGLNHSRLRTLLDDLGLYNELRDKIVLTGYVADNDLPVIFSMSELFLFPSLREGFGIPILEAMACGTPVITSVTSSMPEVSGNSACLVNPFNTDEISTAIVRVLSDEDYRLQLIDKGLEHCASFSWSRSAKQVLELYKQLDKEQKVRNNDKG